MIFAGRDIIHFEVLGQHMMVVNSRELARELFEKRSRIYSDRPYVPMVDLSVAISILSVSDSEIEIDWVGWTWISVRIPY
jgi:hypothetical protein